MDFCISNLAIIFSGFLHLPPLSHLSEEGIDVGLRTIGSASELALTSVRNSQNFGAATSLAVVGLSRCRSSRQHNAALAEVCLKL